MFSLIMWLPIQISSRHEINESIFEKKWPKKESKVEGDTYKSPMLTYNKEMD
jgi:hypothetical protein